MEETPQKIKITERGGNSFKFGKATSAPETSRRPGKWTHTRRQTPDQGHERRVRGVRGKDDKHTTLGVGNSAWSHSGVPSPSYRRKKKTKEDARVSKKKKKNNRKRRGEREIMEESRWGGETFPRGGIKRMKQGSKSPDPNQKWVRQNVGKRTGD